MLMKKPAVKISLVEKKGCKGCRRGHKVGDSWDYELDRGKICPMAMHTAFVYADILRCGGQVRPETPGLCYFSCPDPEVLNIFKIELIKEDENQ